MGEDLSARCQEAVEYFKRGDVERAIQQMHQLSTEGHSPAQVFLGWASELGRTGNVNLDEARRWYSAAAKAGNAVGQLYLGSLLIRHGEESAGADWIRRAADQGYAPALYRLGKLYEAGVGVERSDAEGVRCMEKAAVAGHPFAQRWIAVRAIKGRDGWKAFLRGVKWFISTPILAFKLGWNPEDPNILQG